MDETCRLRRGEGYGARVDEAGQSRGVVRAPQRSQLPAVRTVWGFCEGVPSAEKNSPKVFQSRKSPLFQEKQRGSYEN